MLGQPISLVSVHSSCHRVKGCSLLFLQSAGFTQVTVVKVTQNADPPFKDNPTDFYPERG